MTEPTPPSNPRSPKAPISERLRAALRPGHRWFPLTVFVLALALGLLIGLSWIGMRPAQPAPSAVTAATALDPQHPPLPAPMASDSSALPAPMPHAAAEAHVEPTPAPAQSVASAESPTPDAAVPDATPMASTDTPPLIVEHSQPDYPIEAVRANEEGEVRLQITLDALGNLDDVRLLQSSHSRALDHAAMDAVRKWKFRPATHDGRPVPGTIDVPVQFRLDEH